MINPAPVRLACFQPDIPQNLGGMIRLGACFGLPVDVIEPCGFPFSVKALRRSAMDYAELACIRHHSSWSAFDRQRRGRLVILSTRGAVPLW